MRVTWLGWAGVEIEALGATLVIDPLEDARAVFAPLGERAHPTPVPDVVAARPGATAGLLTHLHLDHADAAALARALAPDAPVLEPLPGGGDAVENLALVQADRALTEAGFQRRSLAAWEATAVGPFTVTALPAVDGLGDPQVSWLVEADGVRVLHLGDTMFHGYWWRIARRHGPIDAVLLPVNGAVVDFPHRRPPSPLPAALTPEQAAVAARALGARLAVPIHAEGYEIDGVYEPVTAAADAFIEEAARLGLRAARPRLGEPIELEAAERGLVLAAGEERVEH